MKLIATTLVALVALANVANAEEVYGPQERVEVAYPELAKIAFSHKVHTKRVRKSAHLNGSGVTTVFGQVPTHTSIRGRVRIDVPKGFDYDFSIRITSADHNTYWDLDVTPEDANSKGHYRTKIGQTLKGSPLSAEVRNRRGSKWLQHVQVEIVYHWDLIYCEAD